MGVSAIDLKAGGTVISAAGDVFVPNFAWILTAGPLAASTVAKPELLIDTDAGTEDTHVTDEVILAVVPLL
jgi:hypothetical protein